MIELRHDERGFTLVELLIAIIVLGVLAGIAIFAAGPFRERAEVACFETEEMLGRVVDAAVDAGMGSESDLRGSNVNECLDVLLSSQQATSNTSTVTLSEEPTPGHTLVAISGHRGASVDHPTISGTGWTERGVFNTALGNGNTARGIAVWTKVASASASEPTTISVDWGTSSSKSLLVLEFNRSLTTVTASAIASNDSATTQVTTLDVGAASGPNGPALIVTGIVLRPHSGGALPGDFAWTGIPGITTTSNQDSSVYTSSGYASTVNGAGPHEGVATWNASRYATGFTMVMRP